MAVKYSDFFTLPNVITCIRFITAPIMLWLAWNGYGQAFMAVLALAFLSDILDGFIARLLKKSSELGAMLDTWADLLTYLTIGFGSWWLWPEIVHREDSYLYIILACFLIPAFFTVKKFNSYAGYHTWASKLAAACISISLFPLFLWDVSWPFHFSVFIYIYTALEEIAITLRLKKLQCNIPSIWHLRRQLDSAIDKKY